MAIKKNLFYFGFIKDFILLRYFRINDPYRLLGVLAIMLLLYLPLFISQPGLTILELKSMLVGEKIHGGFSLYTELIDSTAPIAGWFEALFDIVFDRSLLARRILAFFIIFFQAAFIGLVFIDKKAFSESSFVPSVLFVILFSFSFDTLSLTPELLGSGVLLLALNSLYKEIEFREQYSEPVFNVGLFIGIASLFVFSFIIYLLGAIIILAIYSRSAARKYMLMIVGFLLPHLLLISIYFLKDGVNLMWQYYYLPNFNFTAENYIAGKSLWILGIIPLGYLVVSLVMLNRESRFTKYQSQLVQVMFFWMIFSFLQIFYSKDFRPQSFITLIPSFSFFITHFLLMIRRKKLAEINFWVLLGGIALISSLARFNKISAIDYNRLWVKENKLKLPANQKLLVLSNDLSAYKNNAMGTGFLSWNLYKEILEQPDYYEHVNLTYQSFKQDPPDVIIDPHKLMPKVFERIPLVRKQYQRTADGYKKISN